MVGPRQGRGTRKMIRRFVFTTLFAIGFVSSVFAGSDRVAFDVNPLVVAREVTQPGLLSHLPNSRQVETQLDVSALFSPDKKSKLRNTPFAF